MKLERVIKAYDKKIEWWEATLNNVTEILVSGEVVEKIADQETGEISEVHHPCNQDMYDGARRGFKESQERLDLYYSTIELLKELEEVRNGQNDDLQQLP